MPHSSPKKLKHLFVLANAWELRNIAPTWNMLRSEANMFYSVTVSPGGHIKYDWVQTETDYILL